MNYAILIAGGSGTRMKTDIPKQFLSVFDKPIIAYTMDSFQSNKSIDGIVVVCLPGWDVYLQAIAKQFGITKLLAIAQGGSCGQESIYNGIQCLRQFAKPEDIVLVHDANRPFVPEYVISDAISVAKANGNAIPVVACNEAILKDDPSGRSSVVSIPRDNVKKTQTPQALSFGLLCEIHEKAKKAGITSSVTTATLLLETGYRVFYSKGSEKNFKITNPEDLDIFKAMLIASGKK